MSWYLEVLKKYAEFDGRARRKEYWMFVLVNIGVSICLALLGAMIGGKLLGMNVLSLLYSVAVLIPSIAVGIRRLHDTGRSGWWTLIVFVPFIGVLVLLYFAVLDSEPGANAYGPNPKTSMS